MSEQKPDVDIVIRTPLSIVPPEGEDTDRREISACLIVPSKHETFACVTDRTCIAVVKVEGDAEQEAAVDLSMIQHAAIKYPTVVRRTGQQTELFHAARPFDEWKPIGHRFHIEDKSDPRKFPNTAGVIEPIADPDAFQVIRVDADLLCKLAEALNESGDEPHVMLIVPRTGEVDSIRVVRGSDIGIVKTLDSEGCSTDAEIIERFNNTANAFNAARAAAKAKREGGAS